MKPKQNDFANENACLVSGDYAINHLDHLAVIAFILGAPVVVDSPFLEKTLRRYYPQVKPLYIQHQQQILEHIALHHDRVFFSVAPYRRDLSPIIEAFYGKKVEFWYCPHGNSDKTLEHYGLQTHALIYGEQMKMRLIKENRMDHLSACVETGDVRRTFYQRFKVFYDDLVDEEIFSRFPSKKPLYLYAPTWEDFEASSSVFDYSFPLIDQLPDSINLIVKMHPWLKQHQFGLIHLIEEKYAHKSNVVILPEYPLVLPLLERVDVYIGDFSSIGYDFLFYDRPMFFFDPKKRIKKRENHALLHNAGVVISENDLSNIFSFIDKHLKQKFSEVRKKLYLHAFGKERSYESIRHALQESALSETK